MVAKAVKLDSHAKGPLRIWTFPEAGREYVIGADTAGGGSRGDFAVACVIDAETCDVVAGWHERADPHHFGPRCARLGWFYNEAVLAFETQPSAHGLTAFTEAQHYGYERLYLRRTVNTYRRTVTEDPGFHTNSTTKPLMIDRVKKALEHEVAIPWVELLEEMREQRWEQTDSGNTIMVGEKKSSHDDMVDAFALALMVRDDCYIRQIIKKPEPLPVDDSERYWFRVEQEEKALQPVRSQQGRIPACLR